MRKSNDINYIESLREKGILNERIEKKMQSFKSWIDRKDYHDLLINTKEDFERFLRQCKQLKIKSGFKYNKAIKNIDLLNGKEIKRKIEENVMLHKLPTVFEPQKPTRDWSPVIYTGMTN